MSPMSTKPYLVRAIFEWCLDQGYTPYINVTVDEATRVPREHVKNGQIILNLSPDATHQLAMGNEFITFSARFNGVAQALSIPVARVAAVYARENGQGMAFDVTPTQPSASVPLGSSATGEPAPDGEGPQPPQPGRSHLTRIK